MQLPHIAKAENYRTIQSNAEDSINKDHQKLKSNFWGMSLFTLLLALALLSILNLVSNNKE